MHWLMDGPRAERAVFLKWMTPPQKPECLKELRSVTLQTEVNLTRLSSQKPVWKNFSHMSGLRPDFGCPIQGI